MGRKKKLITKNLDKEFARLITLKVYKDFLILSKKVHIDSIIPIEAKDLDNRKR
jgi:hypothetical protein